VNGKGRKVRRTLRKILAEGKGIRRKPLPLYFSDVVLAIQDEIAGIIYLVPNTRPEFENEVQIWSRKVTKYANNESLIIPEHFIFFDSRILPAKIARCIAHELYHAWKHDIWGRRMDPRTQQVIYALDEEKEADIFSLFLLARHPYRWGFAPPRSQKELFLLLKHEAGFPAHLTRKELQVVLRAIYRR
jgi:hypothetical protein